MLLQAKRLGDPTAEWQEIGSTDESISLDQGERAQELTGSPMEYRFTFSISKRTYIQIKQIAGFLKAPKLSYRTIRRDCAKRNRR